MIYEWDAEKAKRNLQKHDISFEEAATVFVDPLALTYPDPDHSSEEDREITVGRSNRLQIVFVSHCQRGNRVRGSTGILPVPVTAKMAVLRRAQSI